MIPMGKFSSPGIHAGGYGPKKRSNYLVIQWEITAWTDARHTPIGQNILTGNQVGLSW